MIHNALIKRHWVWSAGRELVCLAGCPAFPPGQTSTQSSSSYILLHRSLFVIPRLVLLGFHCSINYQSYYYKIMGKCSFA